MSDNEMRGTQNRQNRNPTKSLDLSLRKNKNKYEIKM